MMYQQQAREEPSREEPPRDEPSREEPPREEGVAPRVDKGKRRARSLEPPSERTPLLVPTRSSRAVALPPPVPVAPRSRPLRSTLARVLLFSLLLAVFLLGALALLAYSYAAAATRTPPADLLARALVVRGPDYVSVLNLTRPEDTADGRTEIWVLVHARIGLDGAAALGVVDDEDPAAPEPLHTYAWKALGRWAVRRLGRVSVRVDGVRLASPTGAGLLDVDAPGVVELPLASTVHTDERWLRRVAVPLRVRPTDNGDALVAFAKDCWTAGVVAVNASVGAVHVSGGAGGGWRGLLQVGRTDLEMYLRKQIPTIPGMPTPGRDAPLPDMSRLVQLQTFNLTSANDTIHITAQATLINPLPEGLAMTVPALPFVVSLPANGSAPAVPLAALHSAPLDAQTRPNLTLHLSGALLPLPAADGGGALSAFLARYLSAQDSPVSVSSPLYPGLVVDTLFPAPHPPPRVLRDLALRDMRVRARGAGFVASGTVAARVVLPRGMRLALGVRRILPDVLVFDGPVPDAPAPSVYANVSAWGDEEVPPAPPLPDPLPEGAFAHIRPDAWLPALNSPDDGDHDPDAEDGTSVLVSAAIVDVPLAILPGRERLASDFLGKVVWGRGALAGVQGTAAVTARIGGLPVEGGGGGEIELDGLPFKGEVRIGGRK